MFIEAFTFLTSAVDSSTLYGHSLANVFLPAGNNGSLANPVQTN